jgi:PAS domain S-box-containing protein
MRDPRRSAPDPVLAADEAMHVLNGLADVFLSQGTTRHARHVAAEPVAASHAQPDGPNVDARYRALVEQMPAVVFMAYLDEGIGEAYVSPEIEAALGFTQREWLEDPIRWFERLHPDDKARWSIEAASMFLSGEPLRSAYRVVARDGRVLWFHCQAAMIRRPDGRPWFIQGVAIDITELKRAEHQLQEERNLVSTILDTVGALVAVLDPQGRIVRINRACERVSGRTLEELRGRRLSDLVDGPGEAARMASLIEQWAADVPAPELEAAWVGTRGERRIITWSGTVLRDDQDRVEYLVVSGTDVTERKRLERALLEISGREQRRIGQDLHDGLGQHLTGTAFMSKVLQRRLKEQGLPEATDADKIVDLVNQAIERTRELSRGLVPVLSDADGLMGALQRFAGEVADLFGVACGFECRTPVLFDDVATATHLFHIAKEAVSNAIKHGQASQVAITLAAEGEVGRLRIIDNGVGLRAASPGSAGMGLHIMGYRANMIGGSLQVSRMMLGNGTSVECVFPRQAPA